MVRRFFLRLLRFAPLVVLMAGVNYLVDPAGVFHAGPRELRIATDLLMGHQVETPPNFDERKLQLYWISGMGQPPATIVLGSSRALTVTGPELRNHSVSGASLADELAIWELYCDRGWTPHQVVLEVEPWFFNRKNREERWKSLTLAYYHARQRLNLEGGGWPAMDELSYFVKRWGELFSPSYFQESLDRLLGRTGDESSLKRQDGSVPNRKEVTSPQEAGKFLQPPVYGLESYDQLDPALRKTFEAFLKGMQARGSQVTLLLVPYHPQVYRAFMDTTRFGRVLQAEQYVREQAQNLGLEVRGSYAPVEGDRFSDGQHPLDDVLVRILGQDPGRKMPVVSSKLHPTGGSAP